MKKNTIEFEDSSGNVFADIGLPNPEEHLAKAELAFHLCQIIRARKLTQMATAKLLGIKQPNVSALMKGHLDGFSAERLFRFLNKLDKSVEIVIKDKPRRAKHADVRVVVEAA
jgi:predicted XRE-type DNA-binding protein